MPFQTRTPTQVRHAHLDVLAGLEIPGRWERDIHNLNLTIPFHCCSGKLTERIYSNGLCIREFAGPGNKPFEELNDNGAQLRFSNGNFPDDTTSLQLWPIILSCWSLEFSKEVEKISRLLYRFCRFGNYLICFKLKRSSHTLLT